MFQNLNIFQTSMAMARHAGQAQAISAQNIANADTPGYRATQMVPFEQTVRQPLSSQRATRATHMNGAINAVFHNEERRESQDPNGNTVSLELEMLNAVGAKRQHDRALAIYRNSLNIIRTSLGRS